MDYITKSRCDVCDKSAVGVMYHHLGVPVLFGCRKCHPRNYAKLKKFDTKFQKSVKV